MSLYYLNMVQQKNKKNNIMSNWEQSTGKSISQSFEQFHKDNPSIYSYFCSYALDWIKTGAKKISAKQIIGRIRWHLDVETKGEEAKSYKINDIMSSRYARKFIEDNPDYKEYFELRELRTA